MFGISVCVAFCLLLYLTIIVVIYFMLHDGHQGINGLPHGIKSCPIKFSRLPYYEHLQITHSFDTMYIRKNVTKTF